MPSKEEIISQLAELVTKLRTENTMSSDAGPFQAPPSSGELTYHSQAVEGEPKPHVRWAIQNRLNEIKKGEQADDSSK